MSLLARIRSWWRAHRPKQLDQLLAVEFDNTEVRVRVIERLEPAWNQSFHWADIERVCFRDAGPYASDIVIVELRNRETPVAILTEARGGVAFFGVLCERGFFPDDVWRRAVAETGGALHCWPPLPQKLK